MFKTKLIKKNKNSGNSGGLNKAGEKNPPGTKQPPKITPVNPKEKSTKSTGKTGNSSGSSTKSTATPKGCPKGYVPRNGAYLVLLLVRFTIAMASAYALENKLWRMESACCLAKQKILFLENEGTPCPRTKQGACACPEGHFQRGSSCFPPCSIPGEVRDGAGSCKCPGQLAVKDGKCMHPGQTDKSITENGGKPCPRNTKGACDCPAEAPIQRGIICFRKCEIAGQIVQVDGSCKCPGQQFEQGGRWIAPCPSGFIRSAGDNCVCENGNTPTNKSCNAGLEENELIKQDYLLIQKEIEIQTKIRTREQYDALMQAQTLAQQQAEAARYADTNMPLSWMPLKNCCRKN